MAAPHSSQWVRLSPLGRLALARSRASSTVLSICSCTAPSFDQPPAISAFLLLRGHYYPLRVLKLPDGSNLNKRCGAADDARNIRVMLSLHGIPLGLAVPTGNGNKGIGIADLAVQLRAPGSRGLLDQLAGLHPGLGVFL